MFDKLGPALRRALAETRASNPVEATRQIKQALGISEVPSPATTAQRPRKGLGETLAALRQGGALPGVRPAHDVRIPEGAAFLKRTQHTSSGSRDYRLYVPASPRPRGLIVMLHGCKQDPEDFAVGTVMNNVAEQEGFLVAYPRQPHAANPSGCWNWFRPGDQSRERGEPHIIARMMRTIVSDYGLDGTHVFLAGLSAGGAMAAVMAATYPDLFSAVGIHSGLPYRSATDVPSAFAAMRGEVRRPSNVPAGTGNAPRMIVFHGSADKTVAPGNARLLMEDAQRTHGGARTLTRKLKTGSRMVEHTELRGPDGIPRAEFWMIAGAGHHWSGGDPSGSYSKPDGPSASQEMMRFFLGKPLSA